MPSAGGLGEPRAAAAGARVSEAARVSEIEKLRTPVFVPEGAAVDPVAFSLADTLSWTDILMEHGQFFVMLMPGEELSPHRTEAERFKVTFAQQFDRVRTAHIDRTNYVELNRQTIELVKRASPGYRSKRRVTSVPGSRRSSMRAVWPLRSGSALN